ncbi:DUF6197 family protein [Streptomyces sp. 7N604]|uniref:DUF6197 family protein n=1 Tax=Streptomyces sp. 7N604 TaxID=3457415 RepID=UPI003FD5B1A6
MPITYSTESTVLPTSASALLDWAADHVDNLGLYDGRDGGLYGRRPGVTETRKLIPSMVGALNVAGGDGRRSSARTYDYPALYAAQRLALDVLSDYLAGGAMPHDPRFTDDEHHRRWLVHTWGEQEGRTADEAAAAFRQAARLAERAVAAASRPGRPPRTLYPVTTASLLGWAAAHLEDVTMRPGGLTHDPDGFTDTAPCTLLHALDRAQRAAKPIPADERAHWLAYGQSRTQALRLLADHLAGEPAKGDPDEPEYEVERRRRAIVLGWGNEPGRSTGEAIEALRAAVPSVADDAGWLCALAPGGS